MWSSEAVTRIIYSAADYLIEHEDATVAQGMRVGIELEVMLYGDPWIQPLKASLLDRMIGKQH